MARSCLALIASAVLFATGAAPAGAQQLDGPMFTGVTSQTGRITLGSSGTPHARVEFFERVRGERQPLASADADHLGATFLPGVRWRCAPLLRRFELVEIAPDGTRREDAFDIRTPSCRDRLRLAAPDRVRPRRSVRLRVRDRWGLGDLTARVCAINPASQRRCRRVQLREGVLARTVRVRVARRGQWRLTARLAGHRTVRHLGVGVAPRRPRRPPLPRVLATGDSTIEGTESYLADELGGLARVRREFHIATGISRPGEPTWVQRARRQVRTHRQRVTVISVGAVDGHPMAGVECCGPAWQDEYVRRVRQMLRSYRGDGSGRVLWLTLPASRGADFSAIAAAVNAAVARAARGRRWVRLLRLDEIFTPGGVFRASMPYGGRLVKVRANDGVHLSAAGTEIAARAAANALKAWPGALRAHSPSR